MSRPQLEHAIRAASSSTTVTSNSGSDSSAVTTILLREEPYDVHGIEDQSHRPDPVADRDGPAHAGHAAVSPRHQPRHVPVHLRRDAGVPGCDPHGRSSSSAHGGRLHGDQPPCLRCSSASAARGIGDGSGRPYLWTHSAHWPGNLHRGGPHFGRLHDFAAAECPAAQQPTCSCWGRSASSPCCGAQLPAR